ncbi:MAG TPA: hypothetical protein VGR14_10210 [Verrucomicrobiae bacterium]|jgi:hypothetical protein|nr:hypothetical protein [Verrucomicrobiae bacterium]
MNTKSRNLLLRWHSLEKEDGLRRAKAAVLVLGFAGLALSIFIVFAIVYKLHPIAIAVAAAVMGWVVAERNALRTRLVQWPAIRRYVDWKRVEEDLHTDHTGT